jgi:hypothetical protein
MWGAIISTNISVPVKVWGAWIAGMLCDDIRVARTPVDDDRAAAVRSHIRPRPIHDAAVRARLCAGVVGPVPRSAFGGDARRVWGRPAARGARGYGQLQGH